MSPAGRFPVHPYRPKLFVCTFLLCNKTYRTKGGLKRHACLHRHRGTREVPILPASDLDGYDFEMSAAEGADQPNQHVHFHPVLDGT